MARLAGVRVWRCSACGSVIGLWEQALIVDASGAHREALGAARGEPEREIASYHVACAETAVPGVLPTERPRMALRRADWFLGS